MARLRLEDQEGEAVAGRLGQARGWLVDKVIPHLSTDKLRGTTGERDRLCNPRFQHRKMKPQKLWL